MKFKRIFLLVGLLLLISLQTVAAAPPDIIHEMVVTITPQKDGSLDIYYEFDYEATTDFPSNIQYLQIGVPNSDFTLVDYSPSSLISRGYERRSGTSQVQLDFNRLPKKGDRFQFNFTINQRSMIYKAGNEDVSLQFRPGWFDFAIINELRVILNTENIHPIELKPQPTNVSSTESTWITKNMRSNQKADLVTVIYPREAFPDLKSVKGNNPIGSIMFVAIFIIALVIIIRLIIKNPSGPRRYHAGRYGGGYRGGGFMARNTLRKGGGGGGGCACACACAGGGRVGCSERGYEVLNWLIKNK